MDFRRVFLCIYNITINGFSADISTNYFTKRFWPKSLNIKEKKVTYPQLQLLMNIINEQMFSSEFLWCLNFVQTFVALVILFNARLYPLIRNEYYLIAVGIAIATFALSIAMGNKKLFKLVSYVKKSSLNCKIQDCNLSEHLMRHAY